MGHAVCSDLTFVEGGGCCCKGGNPPMYFRSAWDRLCQQLFGAIPPGMDAEAQLPDITIWKDGVTLVDDSYPYTFKVVSPSGQSPKPYDVVLYKGVYYVIGAVDGR